MVRWGAESLIQGLLKSHLFPAGILAKATSMTHSDMFYRLDISTFYFYEPLLLQIFFPWKYIKTSLYKNWLPLSTITFTVNSHAYNHFYKYIYLFQILYTMKSIFKLKHTLRRFLIFEFDLNVKHRSYFFK